MRLDFLKTASSKITEEYFSIKAAKQRWHEQQQREQAKKAEQEMFLGKAKQRLFPTL